MTALAAAAGPWEVRATYFDGVVDLKAFRAAHPQYPVLAADPLVLELVRDQWAVVTKFGAVALWQVEPRTAAAFLDEFGAGLKLRRDGLADDHLRVRLAEGEADTTSGFSDIAVRDLTPEKIKVIALALAQSVALRHFERAIDTALREVGPRVEALRVQGRLLGAEQQVLRDIGFVLSVRAQVLAHLTLFDKPPDAWESAAIDRLDSLLYDLFDLDERLSAINQKVAFLTDLNETLLEALNHRKSVRLELIVVALIVIEVLMGLWQHLGGR